MTYTLLLRMAGPMQAWGLQSRFSIRDTAREPTRSGVLGLVCAALGRPRAEPIGDLRALRLGVRVDREGQPRSDFHTAMDILVADNTPRQIEHRRPKLKDTEPSVRHYLADAWFTVALAGDDRALLEQIGAHLRAPVWPLFLGRKAFVPGWPVPILDAQHQPFVREGDLLDVLLAFQDPLLAAPLKKPRRVVLDADVPHERLTVVQERMQPDDPVSFLSRRFLPRRVVVGYEST